MPSPSQPKILEPRWRTLDHCHDGAIPRYWQQWLEDRGSLTRRLVSASGGDFRVEILRQFVGLPTTVEARALRLPPQRRALIREVLLIGTGTPWVFARSIVPLATLRGKLRHLRQLDSRPLGELLFRDNSMTRDPVEVARIDGATLPDICAARGQTLWGRRSVFRLQGKPLLVSEIFLPGFNPQP